MDQQSVARLQHVLQHGGGLLQEFGGGLEAQAGMEVEDAPLGMEARGLGAGAHRAPHRDLGVLVHQGIDQPMSQAADGCKLLP